MKDSIAPSHHHARRGSIETCPRCNGRSVYYSIRSSLWTCKRCGYRWSRSNNANRKEKRP